MPVIDNKVTTSASEQEASIETRKDLGKGPSAEVAFWLKEIDIALSREEDWRDEGENVWTRYRYDDRKPRIKKFNILWSNTETQRPLLFSQVPNPDVRRRFRDADPVGKEASEILERGLAYSVDAYDFEMPMGKAVLDYLLPGRGTVRVRYIPTFQNTMMQEIEEIPGEDGTMIQSLVEVEREELVFEEVRCEYVKWTDFIYGYGDTWEDVQWCAFRHELKRDEIKEVFPDFDDANSIPLDQVVTVGNDDDIDDYGDSFKRLLVWEVWDKEKREVVFIAPSWKHGPLKKDDDPLELDGFFPVPKPAIMVGGTLLPVPEYRQYQDQAEELDEITARINGLVKSLKARGVYDATMEEFDRLMDAGDNTIIPAKNAMHYIERGGLANAVWMFPIETIAGVLVQLMAQRESIKAEIFEIIGISDILRGISNPQETLGAQQIKTNFGTSRIQEKQRDIQRYIRDVYRLKAEIMAERFQPQTLMMMTGRMVTPEIMEVLRADALRSYRIDIETDSTVQGVLQEEQRNITELLTGISQFTQAITPAVQSGAIPLEVAKALMLSAVRRFKLGREVEDALDTVGQEEQQQGGGGIEELMQSPEVQQIIMQQAEQMAAQNEQVIRAQTEQQESMAKLQQDQAEAAAELQLKQAKAAGDIQVEREKMLADMQLEREKMANEFQVAIEKIDAMVQVKREAIAADVSRTA